MKCPTDGSVLTMSERSGIEIDYCPTCRGVWLDRGELDKILDRAVSQPAPAAAPTQTQQQPAPGYVQASAPAPRMTHSGQRSGGYQQGYQKKRKEHWLGEIFG